MTAGVDTCVVVLSQSDALATFLSSVFVQLLFKSATAFIFAIKMIM